MKKLPNKHKYLAVILLLFHARPIFQSDKYDKKPINCTLRFKSFLNDENLNNQVTWNFIGSVKGNG